MEENTHYRNVSIDFLKILSETNSNINNHHANGLKWKEWEGK